MFDLHFASWFSSYVKDHDYNLTQKRLQQVMHFLCLWLNTTPTDRIIFYVSGLKEQQLEGITCRYFSFYCLDCRAHQGSNNSVQLQTFTPAQLKWK